MFTYLRAYYFLPITSYLLLIMLQNPLLVGTSKGLVVFDKKEEEWVIQKIHFLGFPVSVVYIDQINQAWWIGISHHHWGQKLYSSKDQGSTWQKINTPKYPSNTKLHNQSISLKKIWCIQQGGTTHPNRIWIGTEPGGLFISEDYGQHFELVQNLWNHPSRQNKNQWFGTGRNGPYIHSIVVDPKDNHHIYVAVSCAGIFETYDSGQTWTPRNKGLIAAYLPNPTAEIGHDPHLLLACPSHPEILWQQNHCGVFRSVNGGITWKDVSGPLNYGFAIAVDELDPLKAWTIPAVSDEVRVAPDLGLKVCYTDNGGQDWQDLKEGLPQEYCFDIVFRHSFTKKNNFLAFGTTTGNLFFSENEGRSWKCIASKLSRIDCISFGNELPL